MIKLLSTLFGLSVLTFNSISQDFTPAGNIAIPSEYEVKNLGKLNSGGLDYSAVPFNKGVVFTSSRSKNAEYEYYDNPKDKSYSDLYYAEKNRAGGFNSPILLQGDVNGKYHDGTCTFTADQKSMVFTRNNRSGRNPRGTIDLKLFESTFEGDFWIEVNELPFNSDHYATCHPSFSHNGIWLYFSSNRPGGFGGMDIYVVEKKMYGGWGKPINLGSKVNSEGNELFPYISQNGILYWSSDGLGGLGGLDIFSLPISNGKSAVRNHLTAPINSSSDDFAFTTNNQETEGYLSSNREGGYGEDDLYAWRFLSPMPKMASICVVEESTGERIQDANFQLNTDGQINSDLNKSCDLKLPIIPGRLYEITVDKSGYLPLKRTVRAEEILANDEWLIPIKGKPPIAMRGMLKDKKDRMPIPFADVKVVNSCTGKKTKIVTDLYGEFMFPIDCNCDYEILAEKSDYYDEKEVVYADDIQCGEEMISILLYLEKEESNLNTEPVFELGIVIKLDKLYYDYDKFFIRPDAAVELDRVVGYLKKYSSLELELGSHTDSRGSDEYNRKLSQNRADAAVKYIISKGISPSRIIAKGYGEWQLVNHCSNGVHCTDDEHEQNRRTEIKVTRINEKGVTVDN